MAPPAMHDALRARAVALRTARSWFAARGYDEVVTPAIVPSPALEPTLFALSAGDGWLRTSPEFALKKAIASGLGRVYEIGPCFRDREHGDWHRTEFLMLEWYRVGAHLDVIIDELIDLITAIARSLGVPAPGPWQRHTVAGLLNAHTGLDLATAGAADLSPRDPDWDTAFFRRWIEDVEPKLGGAVIVQDWPASQAALSEVRSARTWPVAKRFEAYLHGIELANAFQELTDAAELARRFEASSAQRRADGEAPHPVDADLLAAVARMPLTSGIAVGVDRVVATLLGWPGIGPGRFERRP